MSKEDYSSKALAGKSQEKLLEALAFLKKELFNLRFQHSAGDLSNTSAFSKARKNIARIYSELNKRKLTGE